VFEIESAGVISPDKKVGELAKEMIYFISFLIGTCHGKQHLQQ
jgi:hypothetical protein